MHIVLELPEGTGTDYAQQWVNRANLARHPRQVVGPITEVVALRENGSPMFGSIDIVEARLVNRG